MIRPYNRLGGVSKEWVKVRRMTQADYTVPVKGRRKPMSGDLSLTQVAGDGKWGFGTRRSNRDKTKITTGMDGQFVRDKKSVARKRKKTSHLITLESLKPLQEHPVAR